MKDLGTIIENGNMKIAIMHVPYRKKINLCIFEEPNVYVSVATFGNDQCAVMFMQYLADMIGAERTEE